MATVNQMVRKLRTLVLVQAALACALPLTMPAADLVQNPGFEKPAPGVPPGTAVSFTSLCNAGGGSAAAGWTVYTNSCPADISTTLVPSTAPNGGYYMMHVVTNEVNGGIVTTFASQPQTLSSVWIFINAGCVGIGTGDGSNTIWDDEVTCITGQWVHFFHVPNGISPASEFVVYAVADPINLATLAADFYVDNVNVVASSN